MNTATGRSLRQRNKWQSHATNCRRCLHHALNRLSKNKQLQECENALNSQLYRALNLSIAEIWPSCSVSLRPECPLPADDDEDDTNHRLRPAPDFTWGYRDDQTTEPQQANRDYIIECKRLRSKKNSRSFTKDYVTDGIARFRDPEKGYAYGVPIGIMVGYIQLGEFSTLLDEVNQHAQTAKFPPLNLASRGWQVESVSNLSHRFSRKFPLSPFLLEHYWIDIRSKT